MKKDVKIIEFLPEIYAHLLPEFFSSTIPEETLADCSRCPMLATNRPAPAFPGKTYASDARCCTFQPELMNFSVGAILSSKNPYLITGKKIIRQRIQSGIGVTPAGILPSKKRLLLHESNLSRFGQNPELICPYYRKEKASCAIWPYREATCITFFCRHVAGVDGAIFWNAMKSFLIYMENALARYVMYSLGFDVFTVMEILKSYFTDTDTLTPGDLQEGPLPPHISRILWGRWYSHEKEYFNEAMKIVRLMKREDLERILGINGLIRLDALKRAYVKMMNPVISGDFTLNPGMGVVACKRKSIIVETDEGLMELKREIYDTLLRTAGKRVSKEWLLRHGISEALLTTLYRNRILL